MDLTRNLGFFPWNPFCQRLKRHAGNQSPPVTGGQEGTHLTGFQLGLCGGFSLPKPSGADGAGKGLSERHFFLLGLPPDTAFHSPHLLLPVFLPGHSLSSLSGSPTPKNPVPPVLLHFSPWIVLPLLWECGQGSPGEGTSILRARASERCNLPSV